MSEVTQVVWTKSKVQSLITTNDKAAIRALMVVYGNQTQAEQATEHTAEHNGIGFGKMDAEILTSFAKFYERAGFLTDKQIALLKKRIVKYWKQLLKAAEAKGQQVCYTPTK